MRLNLSNRSDGDGRDSEQASVGPDGSPVVRPEARAGRTELMTRKHAQAGGKVRRQLEITRNWVMLGKLASGIVHEINNPLDGVISCLQEMRSGRIPPEKREQYLELAEEQLLRVGVITKRLLALARDPGFAPVPSDINDLLSKALFFVDYRMKRKSITARKELAAGLPQVPVDPGGILQVVTNLYLNAIDSMGPGGVMTVRTSADEDFVLVTVADTGPGIAPEARERIFEPFYSTKHSSGAGLGLSICLSIAEQHGGTIEVGDSPGQGAEFTVRLPRQ